MNAWIVGIGGPALVFLGGLLNALFRRKNEKANRKLADAQAADVIQGAALSLLQPLRNQVEALQQQLRKQQVETDELRTETVELKAETVELKKRMRCLEKAHDEALLRAVEAEQRAADAEAELLRLKAS